MSARVSPRPHPAKIDALFAGDRRLPEDSGGGGPARAQLLLQAALEAEVTEFLRPGPLPARHRQSRTHSAHATGTSSKDGEDHRRPCDLSGPSCAAPPLFASRLFRQADVTKTNALE